MTKTPLFLLLGAFFLSLPSLAVDLRELPALSADGKQVAFHEYFSDSMGMDSRVKFVKTGTEEGRTYHIICTECRRRDSDEIDKKLKDGGFKPLKQHKFPKKRRSFKFTLEGITIKIKKIKTGYHITAVKDGKTIGKAKYKPEPEIEEVTVAVLVSKPTLCLYLELGLENGTTWTVVPL